MNKSVSSVKLLGGKFQPAHKRWFFWRKCALRMNRWINNLFVYADILVFIRMCKTYVRNMVLGIWITSSIGMNRDLFFKNMGVLVNCPSLWSQSDSTSKTTGAQPAEVYDLVVNSARRAMRVRAFLRVFCRTIMVWGNVRMVGAESCHVRYPGQRLTAAISQWLWWLINWE